MTIDLALELLLALLSKTGEISALISKARSEGRDITDAEFAAVVAADDAARQRLVDAIAAKGK